MATFKIVEVTKDGIKIEWDGVLTLNHDIPLVMLTLNPPQAAVEQAIEELYPSHELNPVATDVELVNASSFVGLEKTFTYIDPVGNVSTEVV